MVEAIVAYVVGPALVAAIAAVPATITARRAKSAADGAKAAASSAAYAASEVGPSSASVLAALNRVEGKVDTVHAEVRRVSDWAAVHEAQHSLSTGQGVRRLRP